MCKAYVDYPDTWKPETVLAALQACSTQPYDWRGIIPEAVLVVNCLPFDDPGRDRGASRHCGYNPGIMRFLANNDAAVIAFGQLRSDLERLRLEEHRDIYVVFICRSGKHRSVGMCALLETMVARDDLYSVFHTCLMTDLYSACACRVCPECDFRVLETWARVEVTRSLRSIWPERTMGGIRV
jgi:hypothetical protein